MDKDLELQRIKEAVQTILDRNFPKYLEDMKKHWPRCWKCGKEMCQILKKNENTFYQCLEAGCGTRTFGV